MRDSMAPDPGSGSHKTMIFLLVGGTALMIAAGVVLFLRNAEPKSTPLPPTEEPSLAIKPLVTAPHRGPVLGETATDSDTAAHQDTISDDNAPAPSKKKEFVAAVGKIDSKVVNVYINNHFGQVKACYERRLKVDSFLEGKLDLNIGISTSGKVSTVTVNSDTVRDAQMLSCVKTVIRGWEFPKPEGGRVVIAKTFNFKKKDR